MTRTKGEPSKPLLIGEAPSKSGDRYWMFPLSGAVAQTLCEMAGISPQPGGSRYGRWTWALYDHFECENLIERWPGRLGSGSAFPLDVARPLAFAKAEKDMLGRVVVLLGARLRDLFLNHHVQLSAPGFYVWYDSVEVTMATGDRFDWHGEQVPNYRAVYCPCRVVAIPHPSGLNRMLNDPAERERCGAALRDAMQLASMLAKS